MTTEEYQASREEALKTRPDDFVDMTELIAASRKHPISGKLEILINPGSTRQDCIISLGEFTTKLTTHANIKEARQIREKSKIVKPKGSIMNFVRGNGRK